MQTLPKYIDYDNNQERKLFNECIIGYSNEYGQYLIHGNNIYEFKKLVKINNTLKYEFGEYTLELFISRNNDLVYNLYTPIYHYKKQFVGVINKKIRKKYKRLTSVIQLELDDIYLLMKR